MFVDYLDTRFIARPLPINHFPNVALRKNQLQMVFGLILVAVIVMLIQIACSQLAYETVLFEESLKIFPSPRSELIADYSPWKPVEFKPIRSEIVDEIYRDRGLLDYVNQNNSQVLVTWPNIVEITSNP